MPATARQGPITKREEYKEFKPFLTVNRSGEVTLDRRTAIWRDEILNGRRPMFPWTSLRDGNLVGPGDRKEEAKSPEELLA